LFVNLPGRTLLFPRQNLPFQERSARQIADITGGGYVFARSGNAQAALLAAGPEVGLAVKAAPAEQGIAARVMPTPCVKTVKKVIWGE
jgi:transketolase